MKNKATHRTDGRVEIVTVNEAGTETRTVIEVAPLAASFLVAQLNEAFASDDESDMRAAA